ncbi:MAG TPA: hypothetical protein VKA00_00295 [Trueperaceae bacterium]|nr:hypothetical protein [Trueperaceae bacterium]
MNRQIRREQAKQDRKVAKEKQRKRAARRDRLRQARRRRSESRKDSGTAGARTSAAGKPPTKDQQKRLPGRFSGVLMIATVFFIVLQAAVPAKDATTLNSITGAGFFVLFGYFSELYLERRGAGRALMMTLVSGVLLVVGVSAARLLQPALGMDWLMMGAALPGVIAGAFLGRLVFFNAPG